MAGCNMAMNQTNYALIGKNGCNQFFTYHITLEVVERLKKKANGAVFNAITTRDFDAEYLVIPTLDIIDRFGEIVAPSYNQIHQNCIQNQNLTSLRDTLLPRLMSGELSVDEAESH